jgi:hypothetical protein
MRRTMPVILTGVILVKKIVYEHLTPKEVEKLLGRADEAPDVKLLSYQVLDEDGQVVEGDVNIHLNFYYTFTEEPND